MNTLQIQGVHQAHGSRPILQDISLRACGGELCAIVGENGAGKSTLLDAISGLSQPRQGRVLLDEQDIYVWSSTARALRISSLGQNPALWLAQNVTSYIGQGLAARRGAGKLLDAESRDAVESIAKEFDVHHLLTRSTNEISGGELRRVQIARSLVDEKVQLVVLDEPLAGVDIKHQTSVCDALRRRARAGQLIVFSVHDVGVAYDFADRVIALRSGKMIANGPPAETLTSTCIEAVFGIRGVVEPGRDGSRSVLRMDARH